MFGLGLLLGTRSCRTRRGTRLVLLDKVAWEDTLVFHAILVDVLAAIPVGVLLVGDGDDLALVEVEVVLVVRDVVVQCLDLEHHGCRRVVEWYAYAVVLEFW